MAISKTRTVSRCEVYPALDDSQPRIMVVYEYSFDDTTDDELPANTTSVKHLEATDSEGAATDVSGEDQLVQDIAGAVWSYS